MDGSSPAETRLAPKLKSARLKIQRADKHISDLNIGIKAFFDTDPYIVICQNRPEGGFQWRLRILRHPPLVLSGMIGDALHNLRSSLDHVANALVEQAGNAPADFTGFPIGDSTEHLKSLIPHKVKGARNRAKQEIRGCGPYKGAHNPLWVIHQLDIIDKHRTILAALTTTGGVDAQRMTSMGRGFASGPREVIERIGGTWVYAFADVPQIVEDGAIIMTDPSAEDCYDPHFSLDISVNEPGVLVGEPILPFLRQARDFVAATVARFDQFF